VRTTGYDVCKYYQLMIKSPLATTNYFDDRRTGW
jgi:hypothetical protein